MRLINHMAVVSVLFAATAAFSAPKFESKIVGGSEASIGEFPFIVSLHSSWGGHFCGGSLIRKNWVLTAAHCVKGSSITKVMIGLHDQKDIKSAESLKVKRVIAHPAYDRNSMDYDFALIELEKDSMYEPVEVNLTDIEKETSSTGQKIVFTTAGWGATSESSYNLPNLLQKVEVPHVSQAECQKAYPSHKISARMVCAGYEQGGKDSCQGDSGGPLIARDQNNQPVLVGVVSWGIGCARPSKYGVYANVSASQDWMSQYIQ